MKKILRRGYPLGWRVILIMIVATSIFFVTLQNTFGVTTVLFGDTSVERSQDWDTSGSAEAFQATASTTGTLGALTVYLDSLSSARQLYVALYTNSGGNPGALLTQGSSATLQAGAWNTVTVPSTNVTAGTVYWIAILGTGGTLYFRDSSTGNCLSVSSAQNNLTSLPSSWTTGSHWSTCRLSAYGIPDPSQPILSFSPSNLAFNVTQGGASPSPVQVSLNNTGGGTLNFTAATDAAWLGVSPISGTAPQNLAVTATVNGLAAGTYTGHLNITAVGAQASPGVVTVTLTVLPLAPPPTPTVTSLSPAGAIAGSSAFSLTVNGSNFVSGDAVLWNGSALATTFGSAIQLFAAVPANLIASSGLASVSVQPPSGASSNSIAFAISAPAPIVTSLSPTSATAGGSTFTLTVNGSNFVSGDAVLWNGSALTTTLGSGIQLSAVVPASLIANSGSASVSVQPPSGASSNSIAFAINVPTPQLSVAPAVLTFNGTQGSSTNPGAASLNITNSGNGSLAFTATSDSPWLSLTPASGTAPQTLQVSAAIGTLAVGTYTGHVTVTATGAQNSPASITVTFNVAADVPPVITSASTSSVTSSGAVISWITDKAASSQVNYGTTTAYGSSSPLDSTLVTSHSVTLSGLTAGTLYHFQVQSADSIGTVGTSADLTFSTSNASSSCPCSIWSSSSIPGTPSDNDSQAVELGVKFTSDVSGYITGIRFYKSSKNTGTHTGTLWTTSGTRLATATFTGETSSGWQQVSFATAVAIAANTTYVASYHTSTGFYAGDNQFFASSGVNQPPLHALANGPSGGNGVYVYGSGGAFPSSTYQSSNYWVDVVFTTTQTIPTTTYSISGTITGGNGATVTLSGAASGTAVADGSGNFSFSNLANGTYTVTPSMTGFSFSPASRSATINGANVTGLAFTATPLTFSISGTITGGSGTTVTLGGTASAATTANGSGSYTFSGLTNGSYTVTPSKAGFTMSPSTRSVTINGGSVAAVNFTATALTFSLSGSLAPTTGGAGASVALSGAASASTAADGSGNYSFTGLANGSYAVTPSHSGYSFSPSSQAVTISGVSVTGVNFTATPAAPTYTISGSVTPASSGAGSVMTLSGAASATTTADASGNYSFTGVSNGSYTVTPSSQTATFSPTSLPVTINNGNMPGVNFTATASANIVFFDDFTDPTLGPAWTVISRHGEYAQSETECNIPQQVSVANSLLTITAAVGPAMCGDFNVDGSVRTPPASWPYITGDIQWTSLNFTYGTVTIRGKMPAQSTSLWPAFWLLGSNCQTANKFSGDTGFGGCPNLAQSSYTEIDMVECYGTGWCQFHIANPNFGIGNGCDATYAVDGNFHTFQTVWTPTSIKQYMDGVLETTCNQSLPNPMFLIMQIQTGGAGGTPNNSLLPASMVVDFVKVTQP